MTDPLTDDLIEARLRQARGEGGVPVQGAGHTGAPPRRAHPWDLIDLTSVVGPPPEPTILTRIDGVSLFYPGIRNALFAAYESGKTWIALLACRQLIDVGKSVLYIDFESSPRSIASRLRVMGITDFSRFGYIRPNLPVDQAKLDAAVERLDPELVVVDACAEAMETHDLDENSNSDFMKFSRMMLEPFEHQGRATILLDHLGHASEARTRPRGASAKMATISGSAIRVEVETPFRRGHSDGMAKLWVAKDREGGVRQYSTADTLVGYLHITNFQGQFNIEIESPASPPVQNDNRFDQIRRREIPSWQQQAFG